MICEHAGMLEVILYWSIPVIFCCCAGCVAHYDSKETLSKIRSKAPVKIGRDKRNEAATVRSHARCFVLTHSVT
eukprot:COSAG02_NODE_1492_length_12334_cov_29.721945_6_plen_74_part_00